MANLWTLICLCMAEAAAIQVELHPFRNRWLLTTRRDSNEDQITTPKSVYGRSDVNIEIPDSVFPNQKSIEALESTTPGAIHGWFDSCYKNATLHYMKWLPEGEPEGIVVFAHGINSQCNKGLSVNGRKLATALLVQEFLKRGCAVYTFDQYGHGFSEGKRFLIPQTWENNKQDLVNFCEMASQQQRQRRQGNNAAKNTAIPLFLAGESYGGCLALHVARHFQDYPDAAPAGFDSLLLTAPAIVGDMPKFPLYQILRYVLAPLFPNRIPFFMPNTVSPDRIWRDEQVRRIRCDPDYLDMGIDGSGRKFKLGTGLNLVLALEEVRSRVIPGLTVPFCVLHGTSDYGVPIEGAEYLMDTSMGKEENEFHRMEGAYHDLFTDPLAEEAIGHWMSFVEKRLHSSERIS